MTISNRPGLEIFPSPINSVAMYADKPDLSEASAIAKPDPMRSTYPPYFKIDKIFLHPQDRQNCANFKIDHMRLEPCLHGALVETNFQFKRAS